MVLCSKSTGRALGRLRFFPDITPRQAVRPGRQGFVSALASVPVQWQSLAGSPAQPRGGSSGYFLLFFEEEYLATREAKLLKNWCEGP